MKKLTIEEFIERAKKVHGDKYDYSKVNYINNSTKVCIICPEHGEFYQNPNNHLRGEKCKFCSGYYQSNTEEFIEKAKKVHGNKYDYSKVNYIKAKIGVNITCPIHGDFFQTPCSHLGGTGCPKCANELTGDRCRMTTKEFIEKAKTIHGNRYDYSKVNYITSHDKVCIICPEHGEFNQSPNKHLSSRGCPRCLLHRSKLESEINNILMINNILFESQKTWDWLKYKRSQFVDFYLPDYNIVIECQGIQHFQERENNRLFENLEDIRERDKNKLDLCTENGIKVLYYSNLGEDFEYPYEVFTDPQNLIDEIKKIGPTN